MKKITGALPLLLMLIGIIMDNFWVSKKHFPIHP